MPRLAGLWKEFVVSYCGKQYCGLCGDSGQLRITLFGNSWHFCICPRGRALKDIKERRDKKAHKMMKG